MHNFAKIASILGAAIFGGAFLTFLFLAQTDSLKNAAMIGYFYSCTSVLLLLMVNRMFGNKLTIFSAVQQWLLKAFFYTVSLSFVYLIGLLFQTVLRYRLPLIKEIVDKTFWSAFTYYVLSPFGDKAMSDMLNPKFRGFVVTFFTLIFVIAVLSMAGSWVEIRWREVRHRQVMEKAELTALRSQIEPHFLFNSLNTITSLIKNAPEEAEQLLIQLSNLFRYVFLNSSQEKVELGKEIEFTRQYLNLLKARFGEKLFVQWKLDFQNQSLSVPVFLLQPIVENAIGHGWPDHTKTLQLQIVIAELIGCLRIEIEDNGVGIRPERLIRLSKPGHALANISERLALIYNDTSVRLTLITDSVSTCNNND